MSEVCIVERFGRDCNGWEERDRELGGEVGERVI